MADDRVLIDPVNENARLRQVAEAYRQRALEAVQNLTESNQELEAARRRIVALLAEIRALRGTEAA